jgi:hypothetical protein
LFASAASRAGLVVQRSPSIRCSTPVLNGRGVPVKTVTTPDYLVTDPVSERSMYVEVTQGNGDWPSKSAQLRVARKAGVDNYLQLTGDQIQSLCDAPTTETIRARLFELFAWNPDLTPITSRVNPRRSRD